MGAEDHHTDAPSGPVSFQIIAVSGGTHAEAEPAAPLIARLLTGAGHRVLGTEELPSDRAGIATHLRALAADEGVQAVILTGGTGLAPACQAPEAVRDVLDKELPGFGEIFRQLGFQEVGPAAMMSRATCGVLGTTLIFSLPGAPGACRLALEALILPQLGHMLRSLGALSAPAEAQPTPGLGVEVRAHSPMAAAPPPEAAGEAGWRGALAAFGATVVTGTCPALPAVLADIPALNNVLDTAVQRGTATFAGRTWGLYGFPDLLRPGSRVLAIGEGGPWGVVLALHRHPSRTGVLAAPAHALVGWPDTGADLASLGQEFTGRPCTAPGQALAVEGGRLYLLDGGRVRSWDGRRLRDEGPPRTILASLALRWSTR
ncbi:MAG: molybdenum cofactor biosynthesis protein B [Pseudomonadota bacterium]